MTLLAIWETSATFASYRYISYVQAPQAYHTAPVKCQYLFVTFACAKMFCLDTSLHHGK